MLEINKSITITGQSSIRNEQVAFMSAVINTNGKNGINISKNISNQELYQANKEEIQKDMLDFDKEVYKMQDEILSNDISESTTEPTIPTEKTE